MRKADDSKSLVAGVYRAGRSSYGFVIPDEEQPYGDLYIGARYTAGALDGDRVRCRVMRRGKRGGEMRMGGRIESILERAHSQFVGELQKRGKSWYVQAVGTFLREPIEIGDAGAKGAKAGDRVVVELTQFPGPEQAPRGVIVERLGEAGEPGIDILTVLRQFNIPDVFPSSVLDACRSLAREIDIQTFGGEREDLTELVTITIDPENARDFDDAISLTALSKRTTSPPDPKKAFWELGVHIADVSAFVQSGSPIDEEARERGTSVYLPGHVVPMIPEILSNGLCSLQEGEIRLTKSVFIRYDDGGKVLDARFANTRIRSAKRLTYQEATSVLEGEDSHLPVRIRELLRGMESLARHIRKRRLAEGMLVLSLPDVELNLDDTGRVIGATPEDTSFSHTLIEMFMVEANEAVARLFHARRIQTLRRIHPPPDEEAMENLSRFLRLAGVPMAKTVSVSSLQKLINRLQGQPMAYSVNLAILKALTMAEYSPDLVGHFALASDHYLHFTSPIRRYPDLMVHRLLQEFLDGGGSAGKKGKARCTQSPKINLKEMGNRASHLSRRAERAERELRLVKVLACLSDQVGDVFVGIVTGVAPFGIFVQHPDYLVEGLIRIEDLGDDTWEVDTGSSRVVGVRTRKIFRLGTEVEVRISAVNIPTRKLDVVPVETEGDGLGRRRKVTGNSNRRRDEKKREFPRGNRRPTRKKRGEKRRQKR